LWDNARLERQEVSETAPVEGQRLGFSASDNFAELSIDCLDVDGQRFNGYGLGCTAHQQRCIRRQRAVGVQDKICLMKLLETGRVDADFIAADSQFGQRIEAF